jgi:putative oxidoreductase
LRNRNLGAESAFSGGPQEMAMKTISTAVLRRYDSALLLLRLVVGSVFIAHGAQKLFVQTIPGVMSGFTQGGVPYPEIVAPLVTWVEFFGGIALVLGLLTRIAAFALLVDMIAALVLVHLPNGFFLPSGIEFVLTLAAVCFAYVIAGAGVYSLDAQLFRRRREVEYVPPRGYAPGEPHTA